MPYLNDFFSESTVRLGDAKRAGKSKYLKRKSFPTSAKCSDDSQYDKAVNQENINEFVNVEKDLNDSLPYEGWREDKSSEFRFNFEINSEKNQYLDEGLLQSPHSEISEDKHTKNGPELRSLHYVPSDNSFKFNFGAS